MDNKRSSTSLVKHRWWLLCIVSVDSLCIWFCFDTILVLSDSLRHGALGFTLSFSEYTLLYAFGVAPSFISLLLAPISLRRLGVAWTLSLSLILSLLGQSLLTLSCAPSLHSFTLMLCARALYGIGAAWHGISSFIILCRCFAQRSLATSLAVAFSFVRAGFFLNDLATFRLHDDLVRALWIGIALLILALITTLSLFRFTPSDLTTPTAPILHRAVSSPNAQHLYSFKVGFWILSLVCALGFCFFASWSAVGIELMEARYGLMSDAEADYYLLIMHGVPCVTSPLWGVILDKNGAFYAYLLLAGVLGGAGHIAMMVPFEIRAAHWAWLNWLSYSPSVSLLLLGFGTGLFSAALWPAIPSMISVERLPTGYGLVYCVYCLCYTASQCIIPWLVTEEKGEGRYHYVCAYLIGLSGLYCILSLILYLWNKDDIYREHQLRDVMQSRQSLLAKVDERVVEEEESDEDSSQEEGRALRGMVGSTMMMGSVASGVSTHSLFSSGDNASDGTVTMMGFAGEDERVVLRFKKRRKEAAEEKAEVDGDGGVDVDVDGEAVAEQDGDHSSALSVITDDEHCERDRLLV